MHEKLRIARVTLVAPGHQTNCEKSLSADHGHACGQRNFLDCAPRDDAASPRLQRRQPGSPRSLGRVATLPYNHTKHMVNHMKTTLNIDPTIMARLKREAARQGRTMSEMVETALRLMLGGARKRAPLPELPAFHGGRELVDIADRDTLYRAMEER
jgi:plasmid stability protein